MGLSTITAASSEPITSDDAVLRDFLRLGADEVGENSLIDSLIAAARTRVENISRRRLLTQTVRLTLDSFGCGYNGPITLPVAPIQSVDQVQYQDSDGTWQTMPAAEYQLVTSVGEPNELRPVYGDSWPVPRIDSDVVRIDLVVGYGATASDVPEPLLQSIRWLTAHMFMNREAVVSDGHSELPMGVRDMVSDYILWI